MDLDYRRAVLATLKDKGALNEADLCRHVASFLQIKVNKKLRTEVRQLLHSSGHGEPTLRKQRHVRRQKDGTFVITRKGLLEIPDTPFTGDVASQTKESLSKEAVAEEPNTHRYLGRFQYVALRLWQKLRSKASDLNRRAEAENWRVVAMQRLALIAGAALAAVLLGALSVWEAKTSFIQARIAVWFSRQLSYEVAPGPSSRILFPKTGPYDIRLGYSLLPEFIERLKSSSYTLAEQARLSSLHYRLAHAGIFPIYKEKTQTGIVINDSADQPLYRMQFPVLSYAHFDDIPPLVVDTLLFIENRKLLDLRYPYRNPAVELSRLLRAIVEQVESKLFGARKTAGGSTLATQIEKFRHSAEGRTSNASDKLKQMSSATLRAYLGGVDTRQARQQIVLEFINSVPLGAISGQGQVLGLKNSLQSWYGVSGDKADSLLKLGGRAKTDSPRIKERALVYKQVLSLFLAQRRPTYYLQTSLEALNSLANVYVALLAKGRLISPAFRDAVISVDLKFTDKKVKVQPEKRLYLEHKAANSIRIQLLRLLGLKNLYELDRLDLRVKSTFNFNAQREVTKFLSLLRDDKVAAKKGLNENRMLAQGGAKDAIFSFTLIERVGETNVIRVQTDNIEGPFNVNEGGKLELGSTAKLRNLVSYLEIITELHAKYEAMSAEDLEKIKVVASDKLSAWAITYLKNADGEARGLRAMLDAAMARRYSGSTSERFFTGGGSHKFNNFDHDDDGGFWTVTESLQKSINLPFVRLMRDVIQHLMAQRLDYSSMLQNIKDPRRQEYLERFAHKEARHFLVRFYGKYQGTKPAQAFDILVGNAKGRPRRFAVLFRSVYPHASLAEFTAAMRIHYPVGVLSAAGINRLYSQYAPATMNLVDRAYTARIHPLEVWLVAYMQENESLSLTRALNASTSEQLAVYRWLFETKNINRQNKRIQIILEEEAFTELQKRWYKLGFPFGALVPSYATALGSSGDRPLALAELVGIVINNGVRYPTQRFKELRFGENTPFETLMLRTPTPSEQVLNPVIAQVVKEALANVAEKGTAQRIKGAFTLADGRSMAVGGKTGTGDNRYQAFGPGGKLVSSKVVNRTATFVFFIGERFFGVIVVHIPGAAAAQQRFTSALPVQTLKVLAPTLLPLLRASGEISDLKSQ